MRKLGVAVSVGILVSLCAFLQITVAGFFGVQAEIWPMLMAPAMVGLLGQGKKGTRGFYQQFFVGIVAGCAFVLLEHALMPIMGSMGAFIPLTALVALIIGLGFLLPDWFGSGAFVAFCASTILTTDILELTLVRLVVLFVGASIFLAAEHYVVKLFFRKPQTKTE